MNSLKHRREKRHYTRKEKKLIKLVKSTSESEDEGIEHELSYYLNDRVKMMKEVLKIIKPKKIRSMAPDCTKNMDNEEINSMLLEELLGISNKRLRYIFNGQNLNEESSSTDPEDQAIDVISLDDISDDDLFIDLDSDQEMRKKRKKHKTKIKIEPKRDKVKKEKYDKEPDANKKADKQNPMSEKNLMSVLELLELQARARAIKSQIALENKVTETAKQKEKPDEVDEDDDDDDAVIVESPENVEIVITSSESENEDDLFWKNSDRNKLKATKENNLNNEENPVAKDPGQSKTCNVKIIHQTTIKMAPNIYHDSKINTSTNNDVDHYSKKISNKNLEESTISYILPNQNHNLEYSQNKSSLNETTKEIESIVEKQVNESQETLTETKIITDNDIQMSNDLTKKYSEEKNTSKFLDSQNTKDSIETNINIEINSPDKENTKSKDDQDLVVKSVKGENENIPNISIPSKNSNNLLYEERKTKTDEKDKTKSKRKIINKLRSMKSEKTLLSIDKKKRKKTVKERNKSIDDNEEIVLDLEQSEMDCINLD